MTMLDVRKKKQNAGLLAVYGIIKGKKKTIGHEKLIFTVLFHVTTALIGK